MRGLTGLVLDADTLRWALPDRWLTRLHVLVFQKNRSDEYRCALLDDKLPRSEKGEVVLRQNIDQIRAIRIDVYPHTHLRVGVIGVGLIDLYLHYFLVILWA